MLLSLSLPTSLGNCSFAFPLSLGFTQVALGSSCPHAPSTESWAMECTHHGLSLCPPPTAQTPLPRAFSASCPTSTNEHQWLYLPAFLQLATGLTHGLSLGSYFLPTLITYLTILAVEIHEPSPTKWTWPNFTSHYYLFPLWSPIGLAPNSACPQSPHLSLQALGPQFHAVPSLLALMNSAWDEPKLLDCTSSQLRVSNCIKRYLELIWPYIGQISCLSDLSMLSKTIVSGYTSTRVLAWST